MLDTPQAGLKTLNHRGDWTTARLKFLFKRETRPVLETDEVVTAFRDGTVTLRKNRREDGFTFAEQEIGYQGVEPGDLVIHAMDGFAGAIGVSDSRGKGSPVLSIATPIADAEPRFWAYYLRNLAVTGFIQSLAKGIRERSTDFRWKDASNLLVNFPDVATQREIADFLDRETARIDLLIEKKQRLVELWNERIDAEVSGIVLQTNRREGDLVETGVDWLGRIPSSWQLSRVGWELQRITYGFTNPMPTEDEGPFLLTANDVNYGRILWESARHTSQHAFDHDLTDKSRPKKGDVLLTKDGTLGRVAIHDGRPACINQSVALLRPRKNRVTSEFLANVLLSRRYQDRMVFEAGGTTIKHIYITRLQKMPFPIPSMDEQREINAKIAATRQRVGLLGDKINASIDRLKEYRSALITSAVTGQIDVTTYAKSGTPDRCLDAIQQEMEA